MRNTRRIGGLWLLLVAATFAGWSLFTLLSAAPQQAEDAPDEDRTRADLIEAEPDLYGVVRSVDAKRRRLTLNIAPEGGPKQEQTYNVAEGAKVVLDAPATLDERVWTEGLRVMEYGPATLHDLAVDTRVGLLFGANRKAVVAVRSEPFVITAKPRQDVVETNKPFDVDVRVVNVSPKSQSFWYRGYSLTHWKASDPRVSMVTGRPPCGNAWQVTLAPGAAFERTLLVMTTATHDVSFRMSFTPPSVGPLPITEWKRGAEWGRFPEWKRTFWSSEAVLKASRRWGEKRCGDSAGRPVAWPMVAVDYPGP